MFANVSAIKFILMTFICYFSIYPVLDSSSYLQVKSILCDPHRTHPTALYTYLDVDHVNDQFIPMVLYATFKSINFILWFQITVIFISLIIVSWLKYLILKFRETVSVKFLLLEFSTFQVRSKLSECWHFYYQYTRPNSVGCQIFSWTWKLEHHLDKEI